MKEFFKSLKRFSTVSAIKLTVILAILVLVNFAAQAVNINIDVTQDRRYTLSDTSKELLESLNKEVSVYPIFSENSEDVNLDMLKDLLSQYQQYPKVKVIYKDPENYPTFAQSYAQPDQGLGEGSVIVEAGDRNIVISYYEMFVPQVDYSNMSSYENIDAESQLTNAILSVTEEKTGKIYALTGHNEYPLSDKFIKQIGLANYKVEELNLLLSGEFPQDCSLLFITTPTRDWTEKETKQILKYFQDGGKGFFCIDRINIDYPNMYSVLDYIGIKPNKAIIVEGDEGNIHPYGTAIDLIPNLAPHPATDILNKKQVYTFVSMASGLSPADKVRESVTIETLQQTSPYAYGKTGDVNSMTVNMEEGDLVGPLDISVAVTDSQNQSKVVVISSGSILDDNYNESIAGGNAEFIISAINWTQDKENRIYIPPKMPDGNYLVTDRQTALLIRLLTVAVLPGAVIVLGLYVWFRRRRNGPNNAL